MSRMPWALKQSYLNWVHPLRWTSWGISFCLTHTAINTCKVYKLQTVLRGCRSAIVTNFTHSHNIWQLDDPFYIIACSLLVMHSRSIFLLCLWGISSVFYISLIVDLWLLQGPAWYKKILKALKLSLKRNQRTKRLRTTGLNQCGGCGNVHLSQLICCQMESSLHMWMCTDI